MAKKANKKLIGGFVVGAIGILAVCLVIFGSGEFFKWKLEYVVYFEGSVRGLKIGSPVLNQGVQVGQVKKVIIRSYVRPYRDYIAAFIEIDPEMFEIEGGSMSAADWEKALPELINEGLRAQLVTVSFITGQLAIEMSMRPGTPVELKNLDKDYAEIPSIPSAMARLGKSLEKFDIAQINASLISILASADRILANPNIEASLKEIHGALQDARGLVGTVNTRVGPLADNLNNTLTDARTLLGNVDSQLKPLTDSTKATMYEYRKLARNLDRQVVEPAGVKMVKALEAITAASNQATKTLRSAQGIVDPNSVMMSELTKMLKELSAAARSIRVWADYLERHPEALISGKGGK